MANNKPKSLDEIFAQNSGDQKKPQSLEDIFGSPSSASQSVFLNPKLAKDSGSGVESLGKMFMAPALGAISGAGLNYPEEYYPQKAKDIMEESPVLTGLGRLGGGVLPGAGISKTLGLLKGVPLLSALSEGKSLGTAAAGGIEGLISNPGEDGDRLDRAKWGAAIGLPLGLITGKAKSLGEASDVYSSLSDKATNVSKQVKSKIDEALSDLMAKEVAPRQQELSSILKNKRIELNPDLLRGFKREALTGETRQKGGLNVLADILERKQSESGKRDVSAKTGQRVKQYLDQISDYARQKPFSEKAISSDERARYAADILRNKLSNVDPRVSELNEPMSRALKLKRNISMPSETSPIQTVSVDPLSDKGQLIQELDRLSGSDLSGLGSTIREAKALKTDPFSLAQPLKGISTGIKLGKLGVGRISSPVSKYSPTGTKESILQELLRPFMKNKEDMEE